MRYTSVQPAVLVVNGRTYGLVDPKHANEYLEGGARFQGHEKIHHNEYGYFRLDRYNRCKRCDIAVQCVPVRVSKIPAQSRSAYSSTGTQGKPWERLESPLKRKMEPYLPSLTRDDTERDILFVQLLAICEETYRLLKRAVIEADNEIQVLGQSRLSQLKRRVPASREEDIAFCSLVKEALDRFRNKVRLKPFQNPHLRRNADQAERLALEYVVEKCRRLRYAIGTYGDDPGPPLPEVKASIVRKLETVLGRIG